MLAVEREKFDRKDILNSHFNVGMLAVERDKIESLIGSRYSELSHFNIGVLAVERERIP